MTDSRYRAHGETEPGGNAHVNALSATIPFDGSRTMGDAVPGPAHLLPSAPAACVLKNVERFSQILSLEYSRVEVDVQLEREDSPPRIVPVSYRLSVDTDEAVDRCTLLQKNIHESGTISTALASVCSGFDAGASPRRTDRGNQNSIVRRLLSHGYL
ncbi:MAG: putative OsmC-like protein [Bradymonadia bacterium]|jgi:uncharacterized OsmC-like protein